MAYEVSRVIFTCPNDSLVGDAVYISAAGVVSYADIDDPVKYSQALILDKITSTTCFLSERNTIIGGFVGLTAGDSYYLTSTATAGNTISTTESAWEVGIATTTTQLYITNKIGIVWDDLRIPITAIRVGAAKIPDFGTFLGAGGLLTYLFSGITEEQAYFTVQLPHTYREGSDIVAHIHWSPTTTDVGNVIWGLEYSWASEDGSTFPGVATISSAATAAGGTAWVHHHTDIDTISGTGKKISSMLVCRIFRLTTGDDTYEFDAALLEVDLHYQKDTRGSNAQLVK